MISFLCDMIYLKKIGYIFIFIIPFKIVNAQSITPVVVATQGDYFISSGGSLSWTLGEVMGETYTTGNDILTQGFHQPNFLATGIRHIEKTRSVSFLYPNPFRNSITILLNESKSQLQIFNTLGEKVGTWTLTEGKNEIELKDLTNGMYLATITNLENNTKRSYKINKLE